MNFVHFIRRSYVDALVWTLSALLPVFLMSKAYSQERSMSTRLDDMFATKTFEMNVYREEAASLDSEKEFSDAVYPEEELEPVEPDELDYMSELEIQECAVRFPGTSKVHVVTNPRATLSLGPDDVVAIKIRSPRKNIRLQLREQESGKYSDERNMGSYVKGICVLQSSRQGISSNIDLNRVVVGKMVLFEQSAQSKTYVSVDARANLVNFTAYHLGEGSRISIGGEGYYSCPAQANKQIQCVNKNRI